MLWFNDKSAAKPHQDGPAAIAARPGQPRSSTAVSATIATPPPQDIETARKRMEEFNSLEGLNRRLKECCYDFSVNGQEHATCLSFYQKQEARHQAEGHHGSDPGFSLLDIAVIREAKRKVREQKKLSDNSPVPDQEIKAMADAMRRQANWQMLLAQAERKIRRRDNLSPDKPVKWPEVEEMAKNLLEMQNKQKNSLQTPPPFPAK